MSKIQRLFKPVNGVSGIFWVLLISLIFSQCEGDDNPQSLKFHNPLANPEAGPAAGNPDGTYPVPADAGPGDVSQPDQVIGNGTPESCTCEAVVNAVAKGGRIVFNCGNEPVTIKMDRPAKVINDSKSDIIIDGNGLITLSGSGNTRILYMNTCDKNQHWTSDHCQNQETPRLTVQNLTFADGNSVSEKEYDGGGAIWVRGGRFKAVNCRFFNNACDSLGGSWYPVYPQISMHSDTKIEVKNSVIE